MRVVLAEDNALLRQGIRMLPTGPEDATTSAAREERLRPEEPEGEVEGRCSRKSPAPERHDWDTRQGRRNSPCGSLRHCLLAGCYVRVRR